MSNYNLRRNVCLAFIAISILVGVPFWYILTTVYRAPLPSAYIESLHNNPSQDIHMTIPVYVESDTYRFPDIHDAIQIQVNHLLNSKKQYIPWSLHIMPYDEELINESNAEHNEYHIVHLVLDEFNGFNSNFHSKETMVYFDDGAVLSNDLPFFVAQTLVEHTFKLEWNQLSEENRLSNLLQNDISINYSPNIHLSISLLNGDGPPVGWDIDSALKETFTPFRKLLSPIMNFTVDTSIVYFNDLNLHALNSSDEQKWNDLSHIVDLSELSSMNYYSENSALNLAIVFPSQKTNPEGLTFVNESAFNWDSYVIPQWGVLIINKYPLEKNSVLTNEYLESVLYKFSSDALQLLGLSDDPEGLQSPYITIDSFKRLTILRNLEKSIETLWSLVKLTRSFEQMAIPKKVLHDVTHALDLRLEIVDLLNNPLKGDDQVWNEALAMSNRLVQYCETAFFDGEMVQQNFFPQEHKIAVYLPLLGPLSVVMGLGLIAILKETKVPAEKTVDKSEKELIGANKEDQESEKTEVKD